MIREISLTEVKRFCALYLLRAFIKKRFKKRFKKRIEESRDKEISRRGRQRFFLFLKRKMTTPKVAERSSFAEGILSHLGEPGVMNDSVGQHVIERWPSGRVKREYFTIEDGLMEGVERIFYEDGLPHIVCHRRQGKLEGEYVSYWPAGAIYIKAHYKNDELEGLYEEFLESTIKKRSVVFQDGKKHGIEQTFYESRMIQSECMYQYGMKNGLYEEFYENGVKKYSYYYFQDDLHGPYLHFFNSGKKCYELEYRHGKIHGVYTEYYEEHETEHNVGSYCEKGIAFELQKKHGKRMECVYKESLYHGKFIAWDQEGEVIQETFYWNGFEIPKVIFDLYQKTSGVLMGIA